MAGLNVQLKEALNDHLVTLRAYLLATPPPAQPAKPTWTSAVPTDSEMPTPRPPKPRWVSAVPADSEMTNGSGDPMLKRLDELIRTLNEASTLTEGVDTVEWLAGRMRECQKIVVDMESRFKFNQIKLPRGKLTSVDFSNIRGCIQLTSRYYDRLEYYKTDDGKKFLRGAASTKLKLDREGDVGVRIHHFDERIDPLASVRRWDYKKDYLPWAEQQIEKNLDPIEHIVEFLIGKTTEGRPFMDDALYKSLMPLDARLHPTELVGESLTVKVRTHVPGDDRFPLPGGAPRMWTYQVKVPATDKTGEAAFELGSWKWTCEVWSDNAASLPILRLVHTTGASSRREITNDFTRGTLYAMRGPSTMRCYPALKFHSALFDAEVTSAAGILVANEGRVVAIDNRSGHYQPGFRQLQTAVQFLQSNLLFEHDAFVAVHVCNSDHKTKIGAEALYFSPADFLVAAQSGMSFGVVAGCLARMAQQYGHGLPVPARHANLIPPVLSDFSNGRSRWDRMLATYYGGKRGLETIVAELKAILKPPGVGAKWVIGRRDGTPGSKATRREGDHVALASQTLQAIESGGVYCNLPELLRKLLAATRASGGPIGEAKDQISLIQASQRYGDIAKRLAALKPERGHF